MSGGIAYVLDEAGDFAAALQSGDGRVGPVAAEEEMILRHLHSGGDLAGHGRVDVMSDMSRFDGERLHQLIANHARDRLEPGPRLWRTGKPICPSSAR